MDNDKIDYLAQRKLKIHAQNKNEVEQFYLNNYKLLYFLLKNALAQMYKDDLRKKKF